MGNYSHLPGLYPLEFRQCGMMFCMKKATYLVKGERGKKLGEYCTIHARMTFRRFNRKVQNAASE